jgi:23S rRNA (guanine1835-N2)-methyltransferase
VSFPQLKRYPHRTQDRLQAWDAADELLVDHFQALRMAASDRLLILNDHFGALAANLPELNFDWYSDSYVSTRAAELNSSRDFPKLNQLEQGSGPYAGALGRIPKNLSFFEDELAHLSQRLKPGAEVVFTSMLKHLPKTSFELLEKYIGPTRTSLARKKARLIFARFEKAPSSSPYPLRVKLEGFSLPFRHDSNLFSREKLDIGTRFFLEHVPEGHFQRILDLGCGNGVLGIRAKQLNPHSHIVFSDDSRMATLSAEANFKTYFPSEVCEVHWTHCFEQQKAQSLDLVLCNPPFHQGTTVGDHIAWQMFTDSRHALRTGGRLRIVGNSHLQYPGALKKIFGNCTVLAKNSKFTICEAMKN